MVTSSFYKVNIWLLQHSTGWALYSYISILQGVHKATVAFYRVNNSIITGVHMTTKAFAGCTHGIIL